MAACNLKILFDINRLQSTGHNALFFGKDLAIFIGKQKKLFPPKEKDQPVMSGLVFFI